MSSKLAFVEKKTPDMARIAQLFQMSAAENLWANRGPIYSRLRTLYGEHLSLSDRMVAVPVSNGGVALEAMARLHGVQQGRKLRWVGSAYSFQNLGRGYFADMQFLDCDAGGLLDLTLLQRLDPTSYDGIIVTNPFGLYANFSAIADFADANGKTLLFDNASGLHSQIAPLPWQSFSLHHTKPYGAGEGGIALVPAEAEEDLYSLLNYGLVDKTTREHWFENGKLSDIAAAFLIDRLEQLPNWGPQGLEQRERVISIARQFGLVPLGEPQTDIPMTSMPFLSETPISQEAIDSSPNLTLAKYYRPLADLPQVNDIFSRLVNVPCHKDLAEKSDAEIAADLDHCLSFAAPLAAVG